MTATRQTAYENLASLKKSVVGAHKGSDAYEMRDAWKGFERATVVARQLVSENPSAYNLEVLVQLFFEGTQLVPEVRRAIPCWDKGLECIEKLRQLGKTGMALSRYELVFEHAREYERLPRPQLMLIESGAVMPTIATDGTSEHASASGVPS